eukprot:CAMPEP_0113978364 /NCGR_PEP_ID=MMETSP0328-20130328/2330_1 /TAXON_ID=39455 /ORGANISM="Alexandrium minutum" /LENGTH=41 /assembly_acc=CAM_ASM_000350
MAVLMRMAPTRHGSSTDGLTARVVTGATRSPAGTLCPRARG